MSERAQFLDGWKAITIRDLGRAFVRATSMLPPNTLASHGDHIPSWLDEPASTGAEFMLLPPPGEYPDKRSDAGF